MRRRIPMVGKKFSSLKVLEEAIIVGKDPQKRYHCQCDCGNKTIVVGAALRSGAIKSCASCGHTKHGFSRTVEFHIWTNIKYRCNNPKAQHYLNYGGRGIIICQRWQDSFDAFIEDMGNRPTPNHSVERIDNNGPYSPENCKWATRKEQANNTRTCVIIEFNGEKKTITQWSRVFGVANQTIGQRLKRGWPVDIALTKRSQKTKSLMQ
jgi:hypothetical protein